MQTESQLCTVEIISAILKREISDKTKITFEIHLIEITWKLCQTVWKSVSAASLYAASSHDVKCLL